MSQAVGISASLTALLNYTNQGASDLATPSEPLSFTKRLGPFTYGAAINQVHYGWSDERTLAPGATEDINLYALTDGLGRVSTTARIKALCVAMANSVVATGDRLIVGGAVTTGGWSSLFTASNSASSLAGIELGPNGVFLVGNPSAAGYSVTNTVNNILRMTNPGATTVAYDIALCGSNS